MVCSPCSNVIYWILHKRALLRQVLMIYWGSNFHTFKCQPACSCTTLNRLPVKTSQCQNVPELKHTKSKRLRVKTSQVKTPESQNIQLSKRRKSKRPKVKMSQVKTSQSQNIQSQNMLESKRTCTKLKMSQC